MISSVVNFFFIFFTIISSASAKDAVVKTLNGQIRGKHIDNYYSFESIPYAEPPIGENRFEPPKVIQENWNDLRDATKSHSACMQWDQFHYDVEDKLMGDEDCLYLDIFTPDIYENTTYPVLVYIHGGAFMWGSALGNWLRADLIMKYENTVVVFINYRLGPLGFLSTGDEVIAGNMGLKDQRLALQWIKKNILSFNGNPQEILISGWSAGGASVHFQLLSPGAEEHFSAAISMSGTALCPWVLVPRKVFLERTKKLGELLNCPTHDSNKLKKCLKLKPAVDIVRAVKHFQIFQYNPFRVFGPIIESKSVDNSFISDEPEELIKSGKVANIPWIVALTGDEGGYNAADLMRRNQNGEEIYLKEFFDKFDDLAPSALFYNETLTESETVAKYSKKLKKDYDIFGYNDTDTNLNKYYKIQKMFSDELFDRGIWKAIKLHKDFTNQPIYSYLYDNPASFGAGNVMANRTDFNFGSVHGDDLLLVYNLPARSEYPFRPDEKIISNKLINMFRDFAITKVAKLGELKLPQNVAGLNKVKYVKITRDETSLVTEDFKLIN